MRRNESLQQWVADFGDPRSPVALADAAEALLRSSHVGFVEQEVAGGVLGKRERERGRGEGEAGEECVWCVFVGKLCGLQREINRGVGPTRLSTLFNLHLSFFQWNIATQLFRIFNFFF